MKKIAYLALAALTATANAQKQKPLTISLSAQDSRLNNVEIQFAETDTIIPMTVTGDTTLASKKYTGSVQLNITEPVYGVVTYRWKRTTVYLEPGKDFSIAWDLTPAALTAEVRSKKSQINPYLSCSELKGPVMGDFGKAPEEILPLLEEYTTACYRVLDSKKLDPAFTAKERKRISYWIYGFLAQYAQQKPCDDDVYDKLQQLAADTDTWLVQMPEYTNYMYSAITTLALRDFDFEDTPESQTRAVTAIVEYAAANIADKSTREYIIGTNAVAHVANNGTDGGERIKELFEANVTDPEIVFAFNKAWAEGALLTKGKPSPEFTFPSIDGKEVSLRDLRGRYVYIDVWATWCVPCRGELPALRKLEETFAGTNIAFVSLSCDRDRAKWEDMVRTQQLGGIQLWGGEDNEFLQKFRIQGIPRFILIDPNGRIVNPDMTRPSDPATAETLGSIAMPMD